jgi:hypothetical protein
MSGKPVFISIRDRDDRSILLIVLTISLNDANTIFSNNSLGNYQLSDCRLSRYAGLQPTVKSKKQTGVLMAEILDQIRMQELTLRIEKLRGYL